MNSKREIPLSGETFDIAKRVWQNLVPKSGQCDTVQGELLREVEKLRWEGKNNGNANWDEGFASFIAFLETTLCAEPGLSEATKASIRDDLAILRVYENPTIDDALYDRLTEHAVDFCRRHPRLIARAMDQNLRR
jgi:hypothetical protein